MTRGRKPVADSPKRVIQLVPDSLKDVRAKAGSTSMPSASPAAALRSPSPGSTTSAGGSPSRSTPPGARPFGNSSGPLSRRDITKIAQRFNAGIGQFRISSVPKGRLNLSSAGRVPFRPALGRPFGTWGPLSAKPSVITPGYSRMSLRDKDRRPGQGDFRKALPLGVACV